MGSNQFDISVYKLKLTLVKFAAHRSVLYGKHEQNQNSLNKYAKYGSGIFTPIEAMQVHLAEPRENT